MSQTDYGLLDRLLHRVALGSRFLGQVWFDLEQGRARRETLPVITRPVFIAGLARSGSTILLNALYNTGEFRSLTYRDMPFILMPGVWKGVSGGMRKQRESRERAHGDRLMVNYDSPEAFEEVFWRTFHGEQYIFDDHVVTHAVPKVVRVAFGEFVQHVLHSGDVPSQNRYLSKNNNNLLRLAALTQAFPDAVLLIPFRDPVQQAISLLRQHRLFLEQHAADAFSLQYMNWLGHYEFGLGHKAYRYTDTVNSRDPGAIDYWLQCWASAYQHALESAPEGTLFLDYEQMCAAPLATFSALYPYLHLEGDPQAAADFYQQGRVHDRPDCDEALLSTCQEIYSRLAARHPGTG